MSLNIMQIIAKSLFSSLLSVWLLERRINVSLCYSKVNRVLYTYLQDIILNLFNFIFLYFNNYYLN